MRTSDDDEAPAPAASSVAALSGAPVTDRVNVEPPILNGMTASEAKVIGGAAFAFFLVLGGILGWAVGVWQVLLMCAVPGPMATVWMASTRLARIKRNRPDGYYRQAINQWLAARGLRQAVFISHAGYWELGRRLELPSKAGGRRTR